jgi:hypothetical protein
MADKPTLARGPYIPAAYEIADISAVQALSAGEATPEQQRRALKWLIERASGTYEFHYYPSDRDTAFALGRGFVGQQIVKLLTLNVSSLRRHEHVEASKHSPES